MHRPKQMTSRSTKPIGPGTCAFESLSNLRIGTSPQGVVYKAASVFVAEYSEPLEAVLAYFPRGVGYSGGTGGTIRVRVVPVVSGVPDEGVVLGTTTYSYVTGHPQYQVLPLQDTQALERGKTYALLFDNLVSVPGEFSSVNATQVRKRVGKPYRYVPEDRWYSLFSANGVWANATEAQGTSGKCLRPSHILWYAGGGHQGHYAALSGSTLQRSVVRLPGESIVEVFGDVQGTLERVDIGHACLSPNSSFRVTVRSNGQEKSRTVKIHWSSDEADTTLRRGTTTIMRTEWVQVPIPMALKGRVEVEVTVVSGVLRFCAHQSGWTHHRGRKGTWDSSTAYLGTVDGGHRLNLHNHNTPYTTNNIFHWPITLWIEE